jgi:heptaprenyl diphosphate synthase
MNVKKLTLMSILVAAAVVISVLESFIPSVGIPGVKLGLANIVVLITLYELGPKEAATVTLLRVYLSALLRGTILSMGFLMSLSGAVLSFGVMLIFYLLIRKFSVIGVSVVGALFHSIGQILIAMIYLSTKSMLYYFPFIGVSSVITGILVGIVSMIIIKTGIIRKQRNKYNF